MRKPNYVPALAVFAVMFALGGAVTLKSWDGEFYVYLGDSRSPAAIQRNLDFSNLNGSELLLASQRRLVSSARILLQDQQVGIELGNFVTKDVAGNKVLACRAYDRVSVEFRAEGMAESGSVPTMTVESLCREGSDLTRIQPIWIPVEQILNQSPGDLELQIWDKDPVAVKLSQVGSAWPKTWRLTSVRLYNKHDTQKEIVIDPEAVRELRDSPIQLSW